ncbi:hypothetical protein HDU85_000926 [Gaertneriomyces sp. JEL0708]|nr:hypothetical protein HDU85_000926 [Gaertneriomyces sp. JEL0708]
MATGVEVRLRTRVIAWSGMAQYAGFSLTPGVATLIMWLGNVIVSATAKKDESDTLPPEGSGPNLFDCVFPTAFLVITNLALVPVLLAYVPKKDPTPNTTPGSTTAAHTHHHKRPKGKEPKVKDKQPTPGQTTRLLRYAFPLYLLLNLVLRGQIGITETLAPEMYQIHYHSDPNALAHSGRFFFVLGLLGLGSFLSVERLQRVIPGWLVMEGGIAVLVLGVFMVIDPTPVPNEFNRILFYVGTFLVWSVASPICQTLTISLFSTMMGGRKQAGAIGWITTMGSVGRVVGPGMVGIAGGWWANVGGIIGGAICFVGVAMFEFYRRKVMNWKESDEERGLLSEDQRDEEIVWEEGHGCVDVEGCEGGVVDVEGGWRGDETGDADEGEEASIRKDDGTSSASVVR